MKEEREESRTSPKMKAAGKLLYIEKLLRVTKLKGLIYPN